MRTVWLLQKRTNYLALLSINTTTGWYVNCSAPAPIIGAIPSLPHCVNSFQSALFSNVETLMYAKKKGCNRSYNCCIATTASCHLPPCGLRKMAYNLAWIFKVVIKPVTTLTNVIAERLLKSMLPENAFSMHSVIPVVLGFMLQRQAPRKW